MIIFRYLSRELLTTTFAVSAVLLVIIMSGRFIRYMAQAAQGIIDPSVLFLIMGYRLPGFLELILPLGLFLGVLLAYGRMYLDSEMTVLAATGMSRHRLMRYTLGPAALIAVLVGFLSLYLAPKGVSAVDNVLRSQQALTEFDTLEAGRFQGMRNGSRITYTEALSEDRTELSGVFMSDVVRSSAGKDKNLSLLVADTGRQEVLSDGSRYLVLENGYRYDGTPGMADYRRTQFDTYGVLLPKPEIAAEVTEREALPTRELWGAKDHRLNAELQWRLSLPVLAFVVALLAVPLARVNPRQGRFAKLLPAIFLYMTYLGTLIAMRGALDKAQLPAWAGLWWVHIAYFVLGLVMLNFTPARLWLKRRAVAKGAQA